MAAGLDGGLLFPGTAGFPSLLVTYGVANDYFFSCYMAIAVFAATELGRLARPQLTLLAVVVALFGMATVLVLRAHYTMDVFAGTMARGGW